MQSKAGPIAVVGAVIVLLALLFGLYRHFFAPHSPEPDPSVAAEHKDMADFYRNHGVVPKK